jgi:hypothetical protein
MIWLVESTGLLITNERRCRGRLTGCSQKDVKHQGGHDQDYGIKTSHSGFPFFFPWICLLWARVVKIKMAYRGTHKNTPLSYNPLC